MGYNRRRKFMYNRETRRGSPSNFVYVGNEIEVDSSVVLKQSFCRQSSRMKCRQGKAVFEYENIARPLAQTPNGKISEVAFADNFAYYFTDEAPAFSRSDRSKATLNFSAGNIDPNSEDGCNIDLSEVTVDVAAIPQPSRNYIVSRRCRELALRIFLPLLMLFAIPIMNSCNKPDDPTPPTPTPEPQPTEPTKVITLYWHWGSKMNEQINLDTIAYCAAQSDVKTIILFADEKTTPATDPDHTSAQISSGYSTRAFHAARDSLQKRFDISPKVVGSGTIIVSSQGGAQQSDQTGYSGGMNLEDSIWYASKGFAIKRRGSEK